MYGCADIDMTTEGLSNSEPVREGAVREILFEGSKRARVHAAETMARVREAMKIAYC